ncbi:DUF1836 domain-containing protein [Clostridium sp. BJN0001]|uniref:DUF1836 domain-containing protein n=1 Tax=Clostridium sp. BJN0001 TaxID=2930219 RepID=UPI001FD45C5F|nr:DUF1836 domain-containing protein [Clostridium sp. BJN0001]
MDKRLDVNYIKKLTEEMSKKSIVTFDELPKYDLFLSQVIDYLNDEFPDEKFTNNIVQNYIKSEVITKPEDRKKRGYTKVHLIQLVLLSYMRPVLTTEEIKKVFRLAFNEINDRNDDIITWEETFKTFVNIQEDSTHECIISSLINDEKLEKIIKNFDLKNKEEDRIKIFIIVLILIQEASIIKKIVQKLVNEYYVDED